MASPIPSRAFIAEADETLHELAASRAALDAEHGVDFATMPLPGMRILDARYRCDGADLARIQREEQRQAEDHLAETQVHHDSLAAWSDLDSVPVEVPWRAWVPLKVRLVGAGVVGSIEAAILYPPFREVLPSATAGAPVAAGTAIVVALLFALLAHTRAHAIDASETAPSAPTRESPDAQANRATFGLIMVAVAAVFARSYAAWLEHGALDIGVVFFLALMLVFLAAALVLPKSIIDIRRTINQRALTTSRIEAARKLQAAQDWLEFLKAEHVDQPERLSETARSAHERYLADLADQHPDTWIGDRLRARAAELFRTGALRQFIADGAGHGIHDNPQALMPDPHAPGGPVASDAQLGSGPAGNGDGPAPPDGELEHHTSQPPQPTHQPPAAGWTGFHSPEDLLADLHDHEAGN